MKGESMTDCNAGSHTDYDSIVYYDAASNTWRGYIPPDVYIPTDSGSAWLDAGTGEAWSHPLPEQNNNRKENNMIERQTFLDALTDEGKTITPEEREIVRDAKQDKLELLFARLLARTFECSDLTILKEKPKEVLIKEVS